MPRAENIGRRACPRCSKCYDVTSWNQGDLCPACQRAEDASEPAPNTNRRRGMEYRVRYRVWFDDAWRALPIDEIVLTMQMGYIDPAAPVLRDGVPGRAVLNAYEKARKWEAI